MPTNLAPKVWKTVKPDTYIPGGDHYAKAAETRFLLKVELPNGDIIATAIIVPLGDQPYWEFGNIGVRPDWRGFRLQDQLTVAAAGNFVPLVGILVVGGLAILVTLGTKGWIAAVILLGVFLLENQIESHLLQPLVVGRIVRLHPLAIILVLAVGGIVAGIAGAIVAVPAAAALTYAWPQLRRERPAPPPAESTDGGP